MIVEPYHRHVKDLKRVVIVRVLVSVCLPKVMVLVNCGNDVDMVMRCVRMGSLLCNVVDFLMSMQFCQNCFRVLLFDCLDVCYFSKVQLVNFMADIKRLNDLFHV
jgi:hypothetical protein